jgi:hypothetical protein
MLDQKQFTGETRQAAQKAADDWWVEQNGLTRISEYLGPADLAGQSGPRWLATIIYETKEKAR